MRTQRCFCDTPAKDVLSEWSQKESSGKPKLREILQNIWLFNIMKGKESGRNHFRLKKVQEAQQLSTTHDSYWIFFSIKDTIWIIS